MLTTYALRITEECSAACSHCPFGGGPSVDLPPSSLAGAQECEFVVVTGGEPLEAHDLRDWISALESARLPFLIATGGHVKIGSQVLFLLSCHSFCGFSFGSDVLFEPGSAKATWSDNVRLCAALEVPFSISFNVSIWGSRCKEVAGCVVDLGVKPEFIRVIGATEPEADVVRYLESKFKDVRLDEGARFEDW